MPGVNGRLAIRVNDGHTDRIVTRYCRNLRFTKVAPGGHQSISCHVDLPRNTFNDLGPADRLYVSDRRTAQTVIEGYLENPTPVDGLTGQAYDLSAVGGMALANDESRPLVYIDRDLTKWRHDPSAAASSSVEVGPDPSAGTAGDGIRVQFNPGQPIVTGSIAQIGYNHFSGFDLEVGAFQWSFKSGKGDANYNIAYVQRGGTPATNIVQGTISTTLATLGRYVNGGAGHFDTGTDALALHLTRDGIATNVADDTTWTWFTELFMLMRRMDKNGTLVTGSGGMLASSYVQADWVVADLVGRLLTFCDPGTAQIDATTWQIDQLAYFDGVKAAGVLADLSLWEPEYLWEIGETLDTGKHRFAYRAWPTTTRYEVSVKDGWVQSGSDVDLCNRILVSWNDSAGRPQTTVVTADSLGLTGIGLPVDALGSRIKDADPISLPDGFGSLANATRIGGQILTDKINPPRAGRVVVRRPIVDHLTGMELMPWEIEPGYLCRIRETGDELRITQVDYDDDTVSSTLTLGTPVLTTEQRVARLAAA